MDECLLFFRLFFLRDFPPVSLESEELLSESELELVEELADELDKDRLRFLILSDFSLSAWRSKEGGKRKRVIN